MRLDGPRLVHRERMRGAMVNADPNAIVRGAAVRDVFGRSNAKATHQSVTVRRRRPHCRRRMTAKVAAATNCSPCCGRVIRIVRKQLELLIARCGVEKIDVIRAVMRTLRKQSKR